jgi:hypothetical protein
MPSARQFVSICVLWAVAAGGAAATRIAEDPGVSFLDAALSVWAFRTAFAGFVVAALITPVVTIGSRAPRTWPRLALRVAQGCLIGPVVGMAITCATLYVWPPEAMSSREQAWRFTQLLWKFSGWKLYPACCVAGASSVWIAARISRPRAYRASEEPSYGG